MSQGSTLTHSARSSRQSFRPSRTSSASAFPPFSAKQVYEISSCFFHSFNQKACRHDADNESVFQLCGFSTPSVIAVFHSSGSDINRPASYFIENLRCKFHMTPIYLNNAPK